MSKIKGKNYPNDLFLTVDRNGLHHFYRKDPMKVENREDYEVSLAHEIMDFIGSGDITNPVLLHISCAKIHRSEEFNISLPGAIRRGEEDKHFEDLTGSVIDILEVRNSSPEFPLSGVVFNRKGDIVANRRYSLRGECEDGQENHSIVAVAGPAVFDVEVGETQPAD